MKIATSTIKDGTMKSIHKGDIASVNEHRTSFLRRHDIQPADTTLVRLIYEGNDYKRYASIDNAAKGDGIVRQSTITADALVVTQPGHALFLPIADCIGAVIHDPTKNILMVSHLGRHNLEQNGGAASVQYLAEQFGASPTDLTVWLSPAAGKASYPLFSFDNQSLHDVAKQQLVNAGILATNIEISKIDSAADTNYFSHGQYLKGNRETDGRFSIVAIL